MRWAGRRVTDDGCWNYYPGRYMGPRPAILFLGGSEGGLADAGAVFAGTAAKGFDAANVVFPGTRPAEEIGESSAREFRQALAWLAKQPGVDKSCGGDGRVEGAEAALLIATRPLVSAVWWRCRRRSGRGPTEFLKVGSSVGGGKLLFICRSASSISSGCGVRADFRVAAA